MSTLAPRQATVVPVRWPDDAARRNELAAAGIPRLLLVDSGATPPTEWDLDEDWVAADASEEERAHREATLRRRLDLITLPVAAPEITVFVDEDGLARRGPRWVALSALEARLVAPLVAASGRCVSRSSLLAAGWPGEERPARAVDGAVRRVRAKLRPLGIQVHGITGAGYLLEVGPTPVP